MADPPRRFWSQDLQQWYVYDAHHDNLVLQDGRRIQRPANVPRSAFTSSPPQNAASSSNYASNPIATNPNYVTSPPLQQQAQMRSPSAQAGPSHGARSYQDSTQRSATQVDALAENMASVTVSTLQGYAGPPRQPRPEPQPVTPQVRIDNGRRIVEAQDPNTNVRTIFQTAPANAITDPALLQRGIIARSRHLPSDNEAFEKLFKNFRLRESPRKFFTVGKVFIILWVEPAGESNTGVTGLEPGTIIGRYGERAFSKVRRFVVVREGDSYCSALPITTYNRRGVSKPGVNKSEHSIIHTTRSPPDPLQAERPQRGEQAMRQHAIRVDTDDSEDKLEPTSRLDYGKIHTIQHNIKVRAFGKVNPKSMNALLSQFGNVWSLTPDSGDQSAARRQPERSEVTSQNAAQSLRRPSQSGQAPAIGPRPQARTATQESSASSAARDTQLQANLHAAHAAIQQLMQQGCSELQARQIVSERIARQAEVHRRAEPAQNPHEGGGESSSEEEQPVTRSSGQQRDAGARQQTAVDQTSRGSTSSSRAQQSVSPATSQAQSSTGAQRTVHPPAGSRALADRVASPPSSQPRSTPGSSTTQAQSQAQNRARAAALMDRLLEEGKTQDEALAIIRQRFGSSR